MSPYRAGPIAVIANRPRDDRALEAPVSPTPVESLNRYLRHLAVHLRSRADDLGEDPEEAAVTSWMYEGRALFLTAFYKMDDATRAHPAIDELVRAASDRFYDRFEDASPNPKAIDEAYLAAASIETGSRTVPGPVVPDDGVEERATADGFEDDDDYEDDEDDLDEDDDEEDEEDED